MHLSCTDLCKKYNDKMVVDNISINLEAKKVIGLLGPNGAGKTTTFYMLVGLIKSNSGEIKIDDNNINEVNIETTKAIIYPDQEIIESSEFATITTPTSKTTGNGVIADMKKGQVKILSNAKRLSSTDDRTEQLEGEMMLYDLNKKTWVLLKKQQQNDKLQIQERVRTILKTKKGE